MICVEKSPEANVTQQLLAKDHTGHARSILPLQHLVCSMFVIENPTCGRSAKRKNFTSPVAWSYASSVSHEQRRKNSRSELRRRQPSTSLSLTSIDSQPATAIERLSYKGCISVVRLDTVINDNGDTQTPQRQRSVRYSWRLELMPRAVSPYQKREMCEKGEVYNSSERKWC